MKKNDKLHIPISSEQKKILKRRAEAVGLSLAQFCLFILIKSEIKVENIPD